MIAVVDYHKGNLMSVARGIEAAGGQALITDDAETIARADGIVLPGVGAFADASATMTELGQLDAIRDCIEKGVPFLGICLGAHLLFAEGVEGTPGEEDGTFSSNAPGLAVLPGVVTRMPKIAEDGTAFKVPHVGWNTVVPAVLPNGGLADAAASPSGETLADFANEAGVDSASIGEAFDCPLLQGIPAGTYFYFTHSYVMPGATDVPFVVGQTSHSVTFPSAVQYGERCFGVQFHPEKSSDAGAAVLRNFVGLVDATR